MSSGEKSQPPWVAPIIALFERDGAVGPNAVGRVSFGAIEDEYVKFSDGHERRDAHAIMVDLLRRGFDVEALFALIDGGTSGYRLGASGACSGNFLVATGFFRV